jgi:hypothetical protein
MWWVLESDVFPPFLSFLSVLFFAVLKAEIHGCGAAATAAARKEFAERARVAQDETKRPLTGTKRELAQRMLAKKIDAKEAKRKPGTAKKKK